MPASASKTYARQDNFVALVSDIRGVEGRLGVPRTKRLQLFILSCAFLTCRHVSSKMIQLFIHHFSHRRECMSIFHRMYAWMAENGPAKVDRTNDDTTFDIPADIVDEMFIAGLSLFICEHDIMALLSTRTTCSDANPIRGGAVAAQVLRRL